jgi:hypothetical protein
MVDTISMLLGFLVGVVAAGIAVEFGLKKLLSPPEHSKLTSVWSLSELQAPLVVTTGPGDAPLPNGARVVTASQLPPGTAGVKARTNREVRANFAVDAKNDRALLFLGGLHQRAVALWTVDERLISRLRAEFNRLWTRSLDYVEKVRIADVPSRPNATVQMMGRVQDVVPFKDRYLMRLADEGETIGVLVDQRMELAGRRVSVTGIVQPSTTGFPIVEALEVSPAA